METAGQLSFLRTPLCDAGLLFQQAAAGDAEAMMGEPAFDYAAMQPGDCISLAEKKYWQFQSRERSS